MGEKKNSMWKTDMLDNWTEHNWLFTLTRKPTCVNIYLVDPNKPSAKMALWLEHNLDEGELPESSCSNANTLMNVSGDREEVIKRQNTVSIMRFAFLKTDFSPLWDGLNPASCILQIACHHLMNIHEYTWKVSLWKGFKFDIFLIVKFYVSVFGPWLRSIFQ